MTTDRVTARREAAMEHDVQEWSETYASSDRSNRYGLLCGCGWRVELPKRDAAALQRLTIEHALAAADEWDRANGYVTIRLDDELLEALIELVSRIPTHTSAQECVSAVLSVLRESAEPEANR